VQNVAPTFVPVDGQNLNGDEIDKDGITQIRVSFTDTGYDNPLNQYPAAGPQGPPTAPFADQFRESFYFVVDWGGGVVETIGVVNGQLVISPGSTTEIVSYTRASGDGVTPTSASLELRHTYLAPPDPINPAAPVTIRMMVFDDNQGMVQAEVSVENQGIGFIPVAIDTTPQVPRLEFVPQLSSTVFIDQPTASIQSLQQGDVGAARGETAATSERFFELVAYAPDGNEIGRYKIKDERLDDLRGLFATLPDGRYEIYLVRTVNNTRRRVMEVYVRRGRLIDPSDDTEGSRDRPPAVEAQPENQAVPLNQNERLEPVGGPSRPDSSEHAPEKAIPTVAPAAPGSEAIVVLPQIEESKPISAAALRWGASLAGMALVVDRSRWSRRVGAAFEGADHNAWQRLRRAGRSGRSNPRVNQG
jgi:hypothetical protein